MIKETIIQTKTCRHCQNSFDITDRDLDFYEKVSPVFSNCHPEFSSGSKIEGERDAETSSAGQRQELQKNGIQDLGSGKARYIIPPPTLCPDCRQQRRLSFRNERKLYKRTCDATGKEIVSIYSPDKPFKVYHQDYWWSDKWDPMDYGKDFDFSKSFFEQFGELLKDVPQMGLLVTNNNINSEYVNYSANVKNCYLIFTSSQDEDSMYCRWVMNSKNLFDSINCNKSENSYECVDCLNINNCFYCVGCVESYNCFGSYDLSGCRDCIGCYGLRNKKYCINNKEYSREEYLQNKEKIILSKNLLEEVMKIGIHRSKYSLNNENCSGEYIINSKNIFHGFDVENSEDCKYVGNVLDLKRSYDIDFQAFDDNLDYESIGLENTFNILFSYGALGSNNLIYCYHCLSSVFHCFGCIGLRNKSYCILNKQYTKEEYETLVPKIIEHMMKTGEWGEFFPSFLSPFGYNETVAMEYFPIESNQLTANQQSANQQISGKQIADSGQALFNWSDYEAPFPKVEKLISAENMKKIPEDIKDIPDDILNWGLTCEITGKPYRIIKQELEFYRKHNLPIPRKHPDQRHIDRMKLRNPRKLFDRKCDKCKKDMKTTYSPDRPEKVYCEECYNKEVY